MKIFTFSSAIRGKSSPGGWIERDKTFVCDVTAPDTDGFCIWPSEWSILPLLLHGKLNCSTYFSNDVLDDGFCDGFIEVFDTEATTLVPAAILFIFVVFETDGLGTLDDLHIPDTGRWFLIGGGQHNGDISAHFSALLGCKRSGDKARRRSGELGSALFGRAKPFFGIELLDPLPLFGNPPGLYDWVVLDEPGWWPTTGNANGEGDRVGEAGKGDGEGVRASGDNGMCPTDFLRLGTDVEVVCKFFVLPVVCSLCFNPCKVDGLWYNWGLLLPVGVLGAEDEGELDWEEFDAEGWQRGSKGDKLIRLTVGGDGATRVLSVDLTNEWSDLDGITIVGDAIPAAIFKKS